MQQYGEDSIILTFSVPGTVHYYRVFCRHQEQDATFQG